MFTQELFSFFLVFQILSISKLLLIFYQYRKNCLFRGYFPGIDGSADSRLQDVHQGRHRQAVQARRQVSLLQHDDIAGSNFLSWRPDFLTKQPFRNDPYKRFFLINCFTISVNAWIIVAKRPITILTSTHYYRKLT